LVFSFFHAATARGLVDLMPTDKPAQSGGIDRLARLLPNARKV
jgi:hypothetical protein